MASGEGIRSFIHKHSLSTSYKIVPEGDKKINYSPNIKYECPVCGKHNVGTVIGGNKYCQDCCIEYNNTGGIFSIQWDGELVPYYVNEFINCG